MLTSEEVTTQRDGVFKVKSWLSHITFSLHLVWRCRGAVSSSPAAIKNG